MTTNQIQNGGEQILLQTKREQFRVSIRKQQNEKLFKNKRQLIDNKEEQECNDEIIEKWYHRLIDKDIVSTLQEMCHYLKSDQIEVKLRKINRYEIYPQLISIWKTCDLEPNLIYYLLTLFCNLHCYNVFDDYKFLANKVVMKKIFAILQITNAHDIQQQIFFLLGNLVGMDNGIKVRLLADYGFCDILKQLWKNKLIIIERENLRDLCWFLSNFYQYKSTNLEGLTKYEVFCILPMVLEFLTFEDNIIKQYCLQTIKSMIDQKEDVIDFIINEEDIYDHLKKLCISEDEDLEINAAQVMMAFFLGEEYISIKLIERGIIDYMTQLYIQPGRQYQIQIKKIIIWGMTNLCTIKDTKILNKVITHEILNQIFNDALHCQDPKLLKEILELINNMSQINETDLLKYILMSKKTADIIMQILNDDTQKDNTILCLRIIYNFAHKIQVYSYEQTCNMAITLFNSKGLNILLEQFEFSEDKEIGHLAIKIHENFYI